MGSDRESNEFKIGDLVRKVGDDEVGEVVSVGKDGLFVRYKNDSSLVTFYPGDLVERVKTSLEP